MLWLQRQAHVHGTLEIVASGALSRATRAARSIRAFDTEILAFDTEIPCQQQQQSPSSIQQTLRSRSKAVWQSPSLQSRV